MRRRGSGEFQYDGDRGRSCAGHFASRLHGRFSQVSREIERSEAASERESTVFFPGGSLVTDEISRICELRISIAVAFVFDATDEVLAIIVGLIDAIGFFFVGDEIFGIIGGARDDTAPKCQL